MTNGTEPPASGSTEAGVPALSHRRILVVIGGLLLGMLLAALDQTIVATALPTIAGDLHDLPHLSWVVTAYILASTASTPLWGKLGDQYGRKTFFQAAIVIFLVGSALSGLSRTMFELIAFRALQGVGGGGLMIGAQAIVGDVVSPRQRGRYQGLFGAVFGVTSVLGPLIGGFFVTNLSWRWVFYINLPLGAVALVVTAAVLPGNLARVRNVIDYLGTALLAGAATSLVLLTTLGGTTYPWDSAPIFLLGACGVVLLVAFVAVERRAAEPVLPLRLFSNRIFSTTSGIGFIVGFAMFGAITYLPQYMQVVRGASPTESGLQLLPLMAGLLLTSTLSGLLITKWGRYKIFPVVGTAVMTLGMYLLSLMDTTTSTAKSSLSMFVLGVGIGGVMQVLVIAVQNAVDYEDLGVATAGATFFRSIGGSFGTAVFGAIFANTLAGNLRHYLAGVPLPPGFDSAAGASPAVLDTLPPAVHAGFVGAFAASLQTVFLVAVPVSAVSFLLTLLLKEVPLRQTSRAPSPADTLAPTSVPAERSSVEEIGRALSVLMGREAHSRVYGRLCERAGLSLDARCCWLLLRLEDHPDEDLPGLASELRLSAGELAPILDGLVEEGYVEGGPDGHRVAPRTGPLRLTGEGRRSADALIAARRDALSQLVEEWAPDEHADLAALLTRLAHELTEERAPNS